MNRLSRFRFDGNALDLGSEQTILEVGTNRGLCCHTGGNIDFDGYEWTRNFIADFRLGADGSLVSVERVRVPAIISAIDVEFGPDGALYVLEYGSAFNFAAPDAKLSRIEFRVAAP